ncbi:hypothetical protein CVU75_00240 [Candidatus Dependentiae bacterium HGW-Dependentiae-1]|nr:MAG: hypothetical protein CVU75_00240 [Candidatus Dependentiae bacterium HGW-Dependentiae-1]
MNRVNLSDTLAPAQQKKIARWWTFTLVLLGITVITLSAVTAYQVQIAQNHHKEKMAWQKKSTPLQPFLDQEETLKKEEQALIKQVTKLQKYSTGVHTASQNLGIILAHMRTTHALLESLTMDKKSFELQCKLAQTQPALNLAQLLAKELAFENVSITSLQSKKKTEANEILMTIKGSFKKLVQQKLQQSNQNNEH